MKKFLSYCLVSALLTCNGCSDSFLDERPNSNILNPKTPDDFQRLLDNFELFGVQAALPQLSSDEYFITTEPAWIASRTSVERNAYIWDADVYGGETNIQDWNDPYRTIFYSNSIINEIDKVSGDQIIPEEYQDVYGQAHFHRAFAYYDLVKNFSVPFNPNTQNDDLGVPIRVDASVDYIVERASVKECYDQIFSDLMAASSYLKHSLPLPQRNRATKLSNFALYARIHLYRGEYREAEQYCDSALSSYDKLIDYNTLPTTGSTSFTRTNDQLIMFGHTSMYNNVRTRNSSQTVFVDTALISKYDSEDIRLSIYFMHSRDNLYVARGGINGTGAAPSVGFSVEELILTKAECLARAGKIVEARTCLDRLLINRYTTGKFISEPFISAADALQTILMERRKELVWRGMRWDDVKRLNMDGAGILLRRKLGNKEYILEPNSPRYTFNIPQDEINRSGITQNQR